MSQCRTLTSGEWESECERSNERGRNVWALKQICAHYLIDFWIYQMHCCSASLSDLSYAAKGRAPYGATAPKPNPALTTLTTANKAICECPFPLGSLSSNIGHFFAYRISVFAVSDLGIYGKESVHCEQQPMMVVKYSVHKTQGVACYYKLWRLFHLRWLGVG